jgi:hypothetical protein
MVDVEVEFDKWAYVKHYLKDVAEKEKKKRDDGGKKDRKRKKRCSCKSVKRVKA